MSNKLVKMTPEQKERQENENFMKGRPTRMEVANYVNGLMEDHYVPAIQANINQVGSSAGLGLMVLQAVLIDKGICTGEEIEQITKTFLEKQKEDNKKSE